MTSTTPSEFDLDEALVAAFRNDAAFASWFLGRTPFAGVAVYDWSRSDHPWSRVDLVIPNATDGESSVLRRDCETDVLVVYRADDGRRLALHIENKLATGSFTPHQVELYRARRDQWKGRPKLGNYSEALCVLVAPQRFHDRNLEQAQRFDAYVSHEALAEHVDAFRYILA